MAKRLTVEQQIAELVALRDLPVSDETVERLKTSLAGKQNLVIAKAAEVVQHLALKQLQPELEAAFARLMTEPLKNDKACVGKTAVAGALQKMELPAESTYLAGITHVQLEPVWGGESDTAIELRGSCAFGLVQMGYARVMPLLVDLLADTSPEARVSAVQALAATGQESAAMLLRLKVHIGDSLAVVAEALAGLMRLSPGGSVDFVAKFLSNPDQQLADAAAVAMGESRSPEALAALMTHYRTRLTRASRRIVLQAVALIRSPEAIDALVEIVRDDDVPSAVHAIEALSLYRRDEHVRLKLDAITRARGEPALVDAVKEWKS